MDKKADRMNNVHTYNHYILHRTPKKPSLPTDHPTILLLFIIAISVASLLVLFSALVCDGWLCTQEKQQLVNESAIYTQTCIGLWKRCSKTVEYGEGRMEEEGGNCSWINHWDNKDANDLKPTESILVSIRKAISFLLFGFLFVCVSFIICLRIFVKYKNKEIYNVLVFVAVLNILAGLFIFISLIITVVSITDQAGNSNGGEGNTEFPMFIFQYGIPFRLVVSTFVGCQITAVLTVQLYLKRSKADRKHAKNKRANNRNENKKVLIEERKIDGNKNFNEKFKKNQEIMKNNKDIMITNKNENQRIKKSNKNTKKREKMNQRKNLWKKVRRLVESRVHSKNVVFVNETVNKRVCEKLSYHRKTTAPQQQKYSKEPQQQQPNLITIQNQNKIKNHTTSNVQIHNTDNE